MEWYICHRLIRQGNSPKMYGNNFSLCPTVVGVCLKADWKLGLVVQLVRIPACHAGGREFESRPDRILQLRSVTAKLINEVVLSRINFGMWLNPNRDYQ